MYQRFHVFKDNIFFEGNVDFDDTIGEMLIMVKNLRKGKPGAGAWQWGEGVVATGRRCGAWHISTRHRMDMALRHRGEHGDNFGVQ